MSKPSTLDEATAAACDRIRNGRGTGDPIHDPPPPIGTRARTRPGATWTRCRGPTCCGRRPGLAADVRVRQSRTGRTCRTGTASYFGPAPAADTHRRLASRGRPAATAIRRSRRTFASDRVGPVGHVGLAPRRTSGRRVVRTRVDASLREGDLLRLPADARGGRSSPTESDRSAMTDWHRDALRADAGTVTCRRLASRKRLAAEVCRLCGGRSRPTGSDRSAMTDWHRAALRAAAWCGDESTTHFARAAAGRIALSCAS